MLLHTRKCWGTFWRWSTHPTPLSGQQKENGCRNSTQKPFPVLQEVVSWCFRNVKDLYSKTREGDIIPWCHLLFQNRKWLSRSLYLPMHLSLAKWKLKGFQSSLLSSSLPPVFPSIIVFSIDSCLLIIALRADRQTFVTWIQLRYNTLLAYSENTLTEWCGTYS